MVDLSESALPGFLRRVEVWAGGETAGRWQSVWEGEDATACGYDKVMLLSPPTALTRRVRLTTSTGSHTNGGGRAAL